MVDLLVQGRWSLPFGLLIFTAYAEPDGPKLAMWNGGGELRIYCDPRHNNASNSQVKGVLTGNFWSGSNSDVFTGSGRIGLVKDGFLAIGQTK